MDPTAFSSSPSYRTLWRSRGYPALVTAGMISEVGDWVARLALAWLLFDTTGSALWSALVIVFSIAPGALVGPWLSARSSLWSHRPVAVSADLVRAGVVALVALAPSPMTALVGAGVVGIVSVVFESHRSAWLPHLIGAQNLGRGVGLAHALSDATVIVGYAAGGLLVGWLGVSGALWLNAASFVVSAGLLTRVPNARSASEGDEAVGVRSALATLWQRRPLAWLVVLVTIAVGFATGVEAVAIPLLADRGWSASSVGVVFAAAAAVSLVGTLLLPSQWSGHRALRVSTTLVVGAAVGFALATFTGSGALLVVALVAMGVVFIALVPANVRVVQEIPPGLASAGVRAVVCGVGGVTECVRRGLGVVGGWSRFQCRGLGGAGSGGRGVGVWCACPSGRLGFHGNPWGSACAAVVNAPGTTVACRAPRVRVVGLCTWGHPAHFCARDLASRGRQIPRFSSSVGRLSRASAGH